MRNKVSSIIALLAILGLFVTGGCKKDNFNITGTWLVTTTLLGQTLSETYTFVGDERSGEVLCDGQSLGTYSVSGRSVSFTLQYFDIDDDFTVEVYNGGFDDPAFMSGTFTYSVEGFQTETGTWFAE